MLPLDALNIGLQWARLGLWIVELGVDDLTLVSWLKQSREFTVTQISAFQNLFSNPKVRWASWIKTKKTKKPKFYTEFWHMKRLM